VNPINNCVILYLIYCYADISEIIGDVSVSMAPAQLDDDLQLILKTVQNLVYDLVTS